MLLERGGHEGVYGDATLACLSCRSVWVMCANGCFPSVFFTSMAGIHVDTDTQACL